MGDIEQLDAKTDRPHEVALMNALSAAIDEFGAGKMTVIEICGCLDCMGKEFYLQSVLDNDQE